MKRRLRMFAIGVIAFLAGLCSGCTRFEVTTPDGVAVKQMGAPLVSRRETFRVRHQWLDQDNVLHEVIIERGLDENADAQLRAIELAFDAGKMAAAKSAVPGQ